MSIALFAFYILSALTILSALMVISARHPVHAVLWLILAFFNAAGIFLLLGAEFLAMILVIVYVGAVVVLFLFVVMMLDVDFAALKQGFSKHLPIGGLIGGILLAELIAAAQMWHSSAKASQNLASVAPQGMDNTRALGMIIYTDYFLVFQVAGLILLVAMIGAIVLTLRDKTMAKRQSISEQVYRKPGDVLSIQKVETGHGVSLSDGVQ